MSKDKECSLCKVKTEREYLNFDGETGYYCEDCYEKVADRFFKIFGFHVCEDGINLAGVVAMLSVIKRDAAACWHIINDNDAVEMSAKYWDGDEIDPFPE